MKKIISIFSFLLFLNFSYSQLSNKHWLPPLHANENSDPNLIQDHYVYLSTPSPIPFQVTVKNGAGVAITGSPFTISQGNPVRISIGSGQPSVMMLDRDDVGSVQSNKGLILEGQYDFYVSFRVRATNHAEFLSSKGRIGAGTTFRLGSLPQGGSGGIRNFVSSFMATENNTTVNLSDYNPAITFIDGSGTTSIANQTFNLNAGQSVVVSGYANSNANFNGFIGALLTSDKPIVVNTGNLAGGMLDETSGQDFNLDQIVPLEQVGTEYIIMKGNGSNNSERPLVVAHEDNTEIYINGNTTPFAIINAGEYSLIPTNLFQGTGTNLNMYIQTSKKVFLYQIVAGSPSDATSGFYFIPPLSCFWQKSVDLIPDVDRIGNNVYPDGAIIIATEAMDSSGNPTVVTINGNPTPFAPVTVTGNPNWVSYRIPNLSGDVSVESTGALAVGVFGAANVAGYGGYFSGFGSEPDDVTIDVCTGSVTDLFDEIPGNPEPGGNWFFNGVPRNPDNGLFDPDVDPIGDYTYEFTKTCDGVTNFYSPTVTINSLQPGPYVGNSSSQSFCTTDAIVDLTTFLGTNISPNGNWTFNGNSIPDGMFNPASSPAGIYTYGFNASGVCKAVSSNITVTINPSPQLLPVANMFECDDQTSTSTDTDGESLFILTNKNAEVFGTQTNVTVKYYTQLSDAENNNTNNITSIRATTGTIIYFRIENNFGCFQIGNFTLNVNPLPVLSNTLAVLKQCDDDLDIITDFILTEANDVFSTDPNVIFTYHTSLFGAENGTALVANDQQYTATNGDTVWVRVETTEGCYRTGQVNLVVSTTQLPASFIAQDYEVCDIYRDANDVDNDGFDYFDIDTFYTNTIISAFPASQQPFLSVTYFMSYADAEAIVNPITDITNFRNTIPGGQPIWARVDSSLNTDAGCKGIQELQLVVNPLPDTDLGPSFILCVDPSTGIGSQLLDATPTTPGNYTYQWDTTISGLDLSAETNAQYTVTQEGDYSVTVTNTDTQCVYVDEITATYSSEPVSFTAVVTTPAFSSGLTTIVTTATGGYGEYEYSLDLINWQLNPTFIDLPNGTYTVYVRDIQSCGLLSVTNLFAITYPTYFTPNGDGYNDTWNISNLPVDFDALIYIYDRYGKLIKQISPFGEGWNGTFNGQLLPSTDYWFTIEYTENGTRKEFKSHFTLKR